MKNLFRVLGILCILFAIIFFLYGSMKTASGTERGMIEVEQGEGIVMVEENTDQQFARYGFNTAVILGVSGLLLLFLGRNSKENS